MKKIASAFLWIFPILFLCDGVLSLADDVTSYFLPVESLSAVRQIFAYAVFFLSFPYLLNLFFVSTKRKNVYITIPVYNIIMSIVFSLNIIHLVNETSLFATLALNQTPHWIYAKHFSFFIIQLLGSASQVLVGLYCLKVALADRPFVTYQKPRYAVAGLVVSLAILIHVSVGVLQVVALFMSSTNGFLAITSKDIMSIEKVYEKNGKILHLIPMIHVGSESFYKEVSYVKATKKTLFLLEGVSDKEKLMKPIDYKNLAKSAGLESQKDHFMPTTAKEFKNNLTFRTADVDASEFNPETRKFINETMIKMSDKSIFEVLLSSDSSFSNKSASHLILDLMEKRNKKVITELKAEEKNFEEFYIPWGAMHLPELERDILKLGYIQVSSKERVAISFEEMILKMNKKKTN